VSPAKRVTSLDLECPTCLSAPGERCVKLDDPLLGQTSPHPRRRKLAREENDRLFPVHCPGQLPLWGKAAS
jgi:hypothetical protein